MDQQVKNMLDQINKRLDEMSKKQDLVLSVIDKEAQLVRDRMDKCFIPRENYTLDLYIDNFETAVNQQKTLYSVPWHIDRFQSNVYGRVRFMSNGREMEAGLDNARHPLELGLKPRSSGPLKVKATITDNTGTLPNLVIGEKTVEFKEATLRDNNIWGFGIGVVSCCELIEKGYGKKEGYPNGALLVRYEITAM